MIVSATGFSVMSCALKYLHEHVLHVSSFEVIYWKAFSMFFFVYFFIRTSKEDHMCIPSDLRVTVFLRGLTGFMGLAGLFTAIRYTTLSKASILFWTNPIFTALYARIFLKESISYYDWASIFLMFFGVILL